MDKEYTSIGSLNRRLLVRKYANKARSILPSVPSVRKEAKQKIRSVGTGVFAALKAGSSNVMHNYKGNYDVNYDVKYGGKKK